MVQFPFPPAFRLRRKKEYDRVFREGRKRSLPQATVVAAPNGLAHARLGILAGKALGGAVARNRVKRVFREAFRLNRPGLPDGFDLVVVPRPRQRGWDLAEAREVLLRLAAEAAESCRKAAGGTDGGR
ncbi:MAG: ribonuclease P protein component [Planctomycetes bacterium]|nr:ribonuclease P protein component [Planctomycetota bacterium]